MKKWTALFFFLTIPVFIGAQNEITPQPEDTKTIIDSIKLQATDTENEPQIECKNEAYGKYYDNGFAEGQLKGSHEDQSPWVLGGCGGGLLLSCIGAGGVWLLAKSSNDYLPNITIGDSLYHNGFTDGYIHGYFKAIQSKKTSSACMGGIFGTIGSAIMVFAFMGFIISNTPR
jgi:hypothetical protein